MLSVRAAEAARAGAAAALIWMGAVSAQTLPSSHSTVASQESATVAAALADARKLIDAGQPRAAIEKLQKLDARANPRVAELLGVAFYHANDPARAIETLTAALELLEHDSPERREAVQVLGLSHYLAGHLAEAIPYLEEVRPFAPDDIKLAYALGMAYAQTRQTDKARESFARTFGLSPTSAAAHLIAGQMMNRLELEDLAEAELKMALQKDPKLPEAHYLLGQIAIFRSRFDEGLALMREELAINPAHAMALYRIGDIYARQLKWNATRTSAARTSCLEKRTAARIGPTRPKRCCAARSSTIRTTKRRTISSRNCCSRPAASMKRNASSRSPNGCKTNEIADC